MPDVAGTRRAAQEGNAGVPPVHLIVRLELPDKPVREFSYDFRQEVITLGRDPGNDIQIPLTTVSRRHARIFLELGDYFLEDLGSTHGTMHNGKKIGPWEKRLLRDGDTVAVMSFSITFKTSTARLLDRQPGEKTEQLARRMVQEVLSSLGGKDMDPPALRLMNGVDEGKRFEIHDDQSEITIGRMPECDLVLDDQNTSRRHCLIKRTWNGFTAQDLGSKNGVLINGVRIEGPQNLKDGDEIQVGGVKLIFIDPASRILDQFGGFSEETVNPPAGTGDVPVLRDQGEVEDESQQYGESGEESQEEPDSYGGDEEQDPDPGLDSDLPSDTPDDELGADGIEAPGEIVAPSKGIGAEVAILVLGLLFMFGAIGLAIFLYL